MIAPKHVQIGTTNSKLELFDDSPQIIKAGGMRKIQAIRVFYTNDYVRGFEIFYKLNAGDFLKAAHNVPKKRKELQSAVFEIGPDDFISEIMGAYQSAKKNRIVNITFITYRGKVQGFGGKGDQSFRFCYPGSTFGTFKGGFKKQVEWLEIDVYPLPEDFKQEMAKLGIIKITPIQPERTSSTNVAMPQIAKPVIAIPIIIAKPDQPQNPKPGNTQTYPNNGTQPQYQPQQQQGNPQQQQYNPYQQQYNPYQPQYPQGQQGYPQGQGNSFQQGTPLQQGYPLQQQGYPLQQQGYPQQQQQPQQNVYNPHESIYPKFS